MATDRLRKRAPSVRSRVPAAARALHGLPTDTRVRDLLDQQAALRELAITVAEMRPPEVIYELVAKQAAAVAGVSSGAVVQFCADGVGEVVGSWRMGARHTGSRVPLGGRSAVAVASRAGQPARTSTHRSPSARRRPGSVAATAAVAVPISVRRELWGCLHVVARGGERLPADLEERLGVFAELVGLAIANTDTSARLLSQATGDPLTGLLNHRAFQDRVEDEVGRAQRYGRPLALVLLDLDFFKSINDAYGHPAGDAALMQASRLLQRGARAGDVLGRIGGDEFALLLPETTADVARVIAERWAEEFRSAPVGVADHLTMSAGVSDLTHANGSRELLRLADMALYWAKSQGRDTVVVYAPDTVDDVSERDRADRMRRIQCLTAYRSLARAIDARDPDAGEHSGRVAARAARLAAAAGWPAARVALLAEAAQIHDIGKICLPRDAPPSPRRAGHDDNTRDMPGAQAMLSAEMARSALTEEQAMWIEQHQERFDGSGHPRGLAGSQVSEGACLLALADGWDAIACGHSGRRPITDARVLAKCRALAGTRFSPAACDALASVL